MGFLKWLIGSKGRRNEVDDPADNPYSDDDDFSFRDRDAARLAESKHREEDQDTIAEQERESGD